MVFRSSKKPSQITAEFSSFQKERSEAGEISFHRWRVMHSHIKTQLNPYIGSAEIALLSEEKWKGLSGVATEDREGGARADASATARSEMRWRHFARIMSYAASKKYIRSDQVFRAKLRVGKARREEFTPPEYRQLHRFARRWIGQARNALGTWYRAMAYNFVLIMTNTGMRPSEARNLRWRDVSIQADAQGRKFVRLNVRGTSRRSTYCFRHTYATFGLTEGVDVYFLAMQMGMSVKMIEDHYGRVTPVKNADRILLGLPGWQSSQLEMGQGGLAQ